MQTITNKNLRNCKQMEKLFCFEFMGVIHIGQKSRAHNHRL